jgi:protein-S-isoprenylcysteine O-methyltransferase Ste14
MYVGVIVAVLGQAVWFWSSTILWCAVIVAIGFHLRVLIYEEPKLTELFGDSFASYCARVPRWIPRVV